MPAIRPVFSQLNFRLVEIGMQVHVWKSSLPKSFVWVEAGGTIKLVVKATPDHFNYSLSVYIKQSVYFKHPNKIPILMMIDQITVIII